MANSLNTKYIVFIDRQSNKQSAFVDALKEAGYSVRTLDGGSPVISQSEAEIPDLVILSCASIKHEEQELIQKLMAEGIHTLVFCPSLPWNKARSIALVGGHQIATTLYGQDYLVDVVEQLFINQLSQSSFEVVHKLSGGLGLIQAYVENIRSVLKYENIVSTAINKDLDNLLLDVNKIRNLSKGLKQKTELSEEPSVIDAKLLLNQAEWTIPIPPNNIRITWDVANDLVSVNIITDQTLSILYNLVANAIEAMPDGGAISLRAYNQSPFVQIEVADTGPGINMNKQDNVFSLYYSTKRSSGFGLWSARRYARANGGGGDLMLKSEPGQGATFILRLPMADKQG